METIGIIGIVYGCRGNWGFIRRAWGCSGREEWDFITHESTREFQDHCGLCWAWGASLRTTQATCGKLRTGEAYEGSDPLKDMSTHGTCRHL